MKIKVNSIETVQRFCELASKESEMVSVVSDNYVVNGKSVIGMFSLDLERPLSLRCSETFNKVIREQMPEIIVV